MKHKRKGVFCRFRAGLRGIAEADDEKERREA